MVTRSTAADEAVDEAVRRVMIDERLKAIEEKLDSLIKDRDQALRWGILTLGSLVAGLVTWIFNILTRH